MNARRRASEAELKRVAYHEAGHAVAAFLTGVEIESVDLTELDGRATGRTKHPDSAVVVRGSKDAERLALVKLAGGAAEEIMLGGLGDGSGEDDEPSAADLLNHIEARRPEETELRDIQRRARRLDQLRRQAADLLRLNRQMLEVISAALIQRGTLSAEHIMILLRPKAGDRLGRA